MTAQAPTAPQDSGDGVDAILDKLIKDVKFHKKGIMNAKSITSVMDYNDILKVNVAEAKAAIELLLLTGKINELEQVKAVWASTYPFVKTDINNRIAVLQELQSKLPRKEPHD